MIPAQKPLAAEKAASETPDLGARKTRNCLVCGKQFPSEWSGERVCHPCKKGTLWRTSVIGSSRGRPK